MFRGRGKSLSHGMRYINHCAGISSIVDVIQTALFEHAEPETAVKRMLFVLKKVYFTSTKTSTVRIAILYLSCTRLIALRFLGPDASERDVLCRANYMYVLTAIQRKTPIDSAGIDSCRSISWLFDSLALTFLTPGVSPGAGQVHRHGKARKPV